MLVSIKRRRKRCFIGFKINIGAFVDLTPAPLSQRDHYVARGVKV
jgi:hypothetical protein